MSTDHCSYAGLRGSVDVNCPLCHRTNNLQVTAVNTPMLTWVTYVTICHMLLRSCRLMKEQGQSHSKAFQDFEDAFKSKLDAVMSEATPMWNRCKKMNFDEYLIIPPMLGRCVWKVCGWCSTNVQPMFNLVHADFFHAGWALPSACQTCQSDQS